MMYGIHATLSFMFYRTCSIFIQESQGEQSASMEEREEVEEAQALNPPQEKNEFASFLSDNEPLIPMHISSESSSNIIVQLEVILNTTMLQYLIL